jgi:hypothetical protein
MLAQSPASRASGVTVNSKYGRCAVDLLSYGELVEANLARAGTARGRADILGKGAELMSVHESDAAARRIQLAVGQFAHSRRVRVRAHGALHCDAALGWSLDGVAWHLSLKARTSL